MNEDDNMFDDDNINDDDDDMDDSLNISKYCNFIDQDWTLTPLPLIDNTIYTVPLERGLKSEHNGLPDDPKEARG